MVLLWVIPAVGVFVLWAYACHCLLANPRGDLETGLWMCFVKTYARLAHRLVARGTENVPDGTKAGPLVVVANHTAGGDPLLVDSVC